MLAKYDDLFPESGPYDGTLADIGEVVGGATPSKKRPEYYCQDGIGWVTPRDLSNANDKFLSRGADDITEEGYNSCSAKLMPKGSVLFSSRAPIGYVAIAANEVATNQGFKSVVPNKSIGTAFTYCFLVRNKQRIADMGAGTTFPEVSSKIMKSVKLTIPRPGECKAFSAFANPLLYQQYLLETEGNKLAALRDTLLPKLMSGEIDVSKVDLKQLNSHLTISTPSPIVASICDAPIACSRREIGSRLFLCLPDMESGPHGW
ncbi:MAG: restriction endonuclease subunit S [Coriobacteriia bacterium]|nr:MAG: restriction endonuclease subunit S [Coriobacteriia bacterium]